VGRGRGWIRSPHIASPTFISFSVPFRKAIKTLFGILRNYVGLVLLVGIISRGLGETDIFTQSIQIPIPNSLDRCRALKNAEKR
jgi:hypothetical protein